MSREDGRHRASAFFPECSRALGHGTSRRDHVIDDHALSALHISHHPGDFYVGAASALLQAERHCSTQSARQVARAPHAPEIGCNDDGVGSPGRRHRVTKDVQSADVVRGHTEESLDLRRVHVNCDHVSDAGRLEKIRGDPTSDW